MISRHSHHVQMAFVHGKVAFVHGKVGNLSRRKWHLCWILSHFAFVSHGESCLFHLKFKPYTYIEKPAGKVVGNSILLAQDICNPVIRIDITDTEKVQTVDSEPNISEGTTGMTVIVIERTVAHADVYSLIGRCTKGMRFYAAVGRSERQSVGIG